MSDWAGHLLIVGLGASGEAAAEWALHTARSGAELRVSVVDSGDGEILKRRAARLAELGAAVSLGTSVVPDADLVVASPGIKPSAPLAQAAGALGVPVISEVELAYRVSVSPWVAVTGTNGKTTTTALVTHLLREAGFAAEPAGNIGPPAVRIAAEAGPATVIVAEVSSFQLALTERFHPRVSVLLNITPDHLDWHGSLERYAADKARIFANQTTGDTAVIDVDDPGSRPFADSVEASGTRVCRVSRVTVQPGGAYLDAGMLVLDGESGVVPLVRVDELGIRGEHNVSNALAAAAAAAAAGADAESIRAGLRTFRPIEHRLEPAGVVRGVEYFNDSKATNPDAVLKALTAFDERPIIVLLGGRNKGIDMHPLAQAVCARCAAAVLFGEAAGEFSEAFSGLPIRVEIAPDLRGAVRTASDISSAGDVVLLSPGCTSFDEFANYEERGRRFKELVDGLPREERDGA